ncbi:hypothetical protein Drorol1_Dr00006822 [Drosera rotundifolia]
MPKALSPETHKPRSSQIIQLHRDHLRVLESNQSINPSPQKQNPDRPKSHTTNPTINPPITHQRNPNYQNTQITHTPPNHANPTAISTQQANPSSPNVKIDSEMGTIKTRN